MTTNANVKTSEGSHWYFPDGTPCYELPKADGKGMKTPTLADARKLNLLPGVSNILKILYKPALVEWLIEQSCLAVLTSPRLPNEQLDDFVKRILQTEQVQNQEAQSARDRGVQLHDGINAYFSGQEVPEEIRPWIMPAIEALKKYGTVAHTEQVVIGPGYGGRIDLHQDAPDVCWLHDYKTTKKLPEKGAWSEHRLQLAAYARAWKEGEIKPIRTANVYISTVEQGKFVICEHPEWEYTYSNGFEPLIKHWQWDKGYVP